MEVWADWQLISKALGHPSTCRLPADICSLWWHGWVPFPCWLKAGGCSLLQRPPIFLITCPFHLQTSNSVTGPCHLSYLPGCPFFLGGFLWQSSALWYSQAHGMEVPESGHRTRPAHLESYLTALVSESAICSSLTKLQKCWFCWSHSVSEEAVVQGLCWPPTSPEYIPPGRHLKMCVWGQTRCPAPTGHFIT